MTKTWYNHYHMAWRSTQGTRFDLYIQLEKQPDGDAVELTPGEIPVELDIDDSTSDIRNVIRGSSGYVRFVGNFDKWTYRTLFDVTAMARRVVIYRDNNRILWQGFLSEDVFRHNISPATQEVEMSMKSCLAHLDSVAPPVEPPQGRSYYNVAEIIDLALDAVSYYIDAGFYYSPTAQSILLNKVPYRWLVDKLEYVHLNGPDYRHVTTMRKFSDIFKFFLTPMLGYFTEQFGNDPGICLCVIPSKDTNFPEDSYKLTSEQLSQYMSGHTPTNPPVSYSHTVSLSDMLDNNYYNNGVIYNRSNRNEEYLLPKLDYFTVETSERNIPKETVFYPDIINWNISQGDDGAISRGTTPQRNIQFLSFYDGPSAQGEKSGARLMYIQKYTDTKDASRYSEPKPNIVIRGWDKTEITEPIFTITTEDVYYGSGMKGGFPLGIYITLADTDGALKDDISIDCKITCGEFVYNPLRGRWDNYYRGPRGIISIEDGKIPDGVGDFIGNHTIGTARMYGSGYAILSDYVVEGEGSVPLNPIKFEIYDIKYKGVHLKANQKVIINNLKIEFLKNVFDFSGSVYTEKFTCADDHISEIEEITIPSTAGPLAPSGGEYRFSEYSTLRRSTRRVLCLEAFRRKDLNCFDDYVQTNLPIQSHFFLFSQSLNLRTEYSKAKLINYYN